jgi:hypothetical protein
MEAWLSGLSGRAEEALAALAARLEREHGSGPVHLKAVASIGVGRG